MRNDQYFSNLYGLSFQLAIEIVSAVMIGLIIGISIDKWFDISPWGFFICIFFGIISAGMNVYRFVNKFSPSCEKSSIKSEK